MKRPIAILAAVLVLGSAAATATYTSQPGAGHATRLAGNSWDDGVYAPATPSLPTLPSVQINGNSWD